MLSVSGVDKNIFTTSNSIKMLPVVSAEWNQNIFNAPYLTVAGNGVKQNNITKSSGPTLTTVTDSTAHPNFTTYKYTITGNDNVVYSITPSASSPAYKIITYVTTDSTTPLVFNAYAKGGSRQFGSAQSEITSFGWTRVEVYIGGAWNGDLYNGGSADNISSPFTFTISPSKLSSASNTAILYFTQPEVYATTYFDYQYGSIYPTESAFTGFRPGESYVPTGNSDYSFPANYRKVNTAGILKGENNFYMPSSPIFSSPGFFVTSTPSPVYKHSLVTDISSYKYFVSDINSSTSLSARYLDPVLMNKVVLKFNTYLSTPTVTVSVKLADDSTTITSSAVTPDSSGNLVLYLNSNQLTTSRWSSGTMPTFNTDGTLTNSIAIKQITVSSTNSFTLNTSFNSFSNSYINIDKNRMHVIEVSPRLELDLTSYLIDLTTNKSLDGKDTYMPISSLVTDDASITLTGIPLGDINGPIPVFSNVSNYSTTKLKGLLKKNVKFYLNYKLVEYADNTSNSTVAVNKIIPGGVWYSDTWQQNDIDTVSIPLFDITRYLQSTPVTDYVSNYKDAFDVITNILDLTGFTDYDIDSLYSVCYDLNTPLNMDYYFCNSKDTTLSEALNQIFLPYQIGAYIDNFGVMKFLSLSNIMQKTNSTEDVSLNASNVFQNGYSISNRAKPGKISLRYTTPRLKQSLALQNVTNVDIRNGPGFIYTTGNDVVWEQQSVDSVGLNYLAADMSETANKFYLSQADLTDQFHTFNLNTNGYAVIEDEIVSFTYKEYSISSNSAAPISVSVKNDLELAAAINKYIKENKVGMIPSSASITSVGSRVLSNGIYYRTYSYSGGSLGFSIKKNDYVTVSNCNPESLNISAQVVSASSNSFTVKSNTTDSYILGGQVTKGMDYDVTVSPTGYITNVQRGMFGTNVASHNLITSATSNSIITSKDIKVSLLSGGSLTNNTAFAIDTANSRILSRPSSSGKNLFYPNTEIDRSYNTYSAKIGFNTNANLASAGIFFNLNTASPNGTYYLELVRYDTVSSGNYRYLLILSQEGAATPICWADVTGTVQSVVANFEKLYIKNPSASAQDGSDAYILYVDPFEAFHLRIAKYPYIYSEDGEGSVSSPTGSVISVFINNFEVSGWQQYVGGQWKVMDYNNVSNSRKKIVLPTPVSSGTKFGAFSSRNPTTISSVTYPTSNHSAGSDFVYIREIYASQKALRERSVNYYFQDREFLNGLVQNQRLFSNYKEYIMQTKPIVVGLNVYDVQYVNGAAVSVDVSPAEYAWFYYPGNTLLDQRFLQTKIVDEYAVSYSTPINTGFRGKLAAVNNSSHMIFLKHDSDELNNFNSTFALWTHEVVVPSDPEIIEYVTDPGNLLETMQIDSAFIQSKSSANKLLTLVGHSLDNFSKDVSLNIFGNPMLEVGDIIKLTYPLMGINQQKYIVHSISQSFKDGLSTKLTLNMVNKGISL